MKKYVFKLRIPSIKDYHSMTVEERNLTAKIYKFYKNSLFIILNKDKNNYNHYLCAICSDYKKTHCIKEGELWIDYQFLVKISGNFLEKLFVTDLDVNRIADIINKNYKGTNKFPKDKKCNSTKKNANNCKINQKSKSKKQKNIQKSSKKAETKKMKKLDNFRMSRKKKKAPPQHNQIQCLIPMSVPAKHQKYTSNSWYINHPISAGRGNF